jgi:hypothetical protein
MVLRRRVKRTGAILFDLHRQTQAHENYRVLVSRMGRSLGIAHESALSRLSSAEASHFS